MEETAHYGTDALLPIELGNSPAPRDDGEEGLRANLDVVEEVRELA